MTPTPVTDPAEDLGHRALCVGDLEVTLVKFIRRIVSSYRFDNPAVNFAQATMPVAPIEPTDPDQPPIPFDPMQRAQTLALKVPPQVVRGRVPRTVSGEVDVSQLPNFPAILVQALSARVQNDETHVLVRVFVNMYDENPDGSGYQDCQNIMEALAIAFTSYGQEGIDQSYPIIMPLEWRAIEPDSMPHFIGEMTTTWQLPSGRPLPDAETFGLLPIPAEHIELQLGTGAEAKLGVIPPRPQQPPTVTPPPEFTPMGPYYYFWQVTTLTGGLGTSLDGQNIAALPDRSLVKVIIQDRGASEWLRTEDATSPTTDADNGIIVPIGYDPSVAPYTLVRQSGF